MISGISDFIKMHNFCEQERQETCFRFHLGELQMRQMGQVGHNRTTIERALPPRGTLRTIQIPSSPPPHTESTLYPRKFLPEFNSDLSHCSLSFHMSVGRGGTGHPRASRLWPLFVNSNPVLFLPSEKVSSSVAPVFSFWGSCT